MNKGGYEVRKVKGFVGLEGRGFNAELVRDGKPVAFVIDEGNGGCYDFEWYDYKEPRVAVQTTNWDGKPVTVQLTPEEAKLAAFVSTLPAEDYMGKPFKMDSEGFVGALVDDYENDRKFRRLAKTKTLFRTVGDEAGVWRVLKAPFSKRVRDYIVAECAKSGKALECIYNETIGQVVA